MARFTNKEKLDIINQCDDLQQSDVARNFGISGKAVSYILSKSDVFSNLANLNAKTPPNTLFQIKLQEGDSINPSR